MGIFGKTDTRPGETPRPATATTPPVAATMPIAHAAAPAPVPAARAAAAPAPAPLPTTTCVIGAKTRIKGEITGDENVTVDGNIEGTIKITRDLRVGPSGTVRANVVAQSIVVAGELFGDCQATQRVHIEATGKITGNIRAPRVVIVEGATFRGNSDMSRREGEA